MNISNYSHVDYITVPDVGQIGAGLTVEFLPAARKRSVPRPSGARSFDRFISARVCGDSLVEDMIFDGDRLTCRLNFDLSELTQGRLCIVRLPCEGLTIKRFHLLNNGRVRLCAANRRIKDREYELNDIVIKAIVVELVRPMQ